MHHPNYFSGAFATTIVGTIILVMFPLLRHRLRMRKLTGILEMNVQTYGDFSFSNYSTILGCYFWYGAVLTHVKSEQKKSVG